jgi:hypothetical protein
MPTPRKKKKRKTGRPLEDVPLRKLVKSVKGELEERVKMAFSDSLDKTKRE